MPIWKLISTPIIGAIIGYITNWLAVKMLFRPKEAKYIGKFRVPFTPGVIPKGKARLAKAAGNVINQQLLTREALEEHLLSDKVMTMVKNAVEETLKEIKTNDEKTIYQLATTSIAENDFNKVLYQVQQFLATKADEKIKAANLGNTLSNAMVTQVQGALSGSFLGTMIGDSMLRSLQPSVANAIDVYIDQNAESVIRKIIAEETDALLKTPGSNIINSIESAGYDITGTAVDMYTKAIKEKAAAAIEALDIGSIAEKTIESMENDQLEELVLMTMKTELNAIVNLGFIIGLVLGLVNTVIYLI